MYIVSKAKLKNHPTLIQKLESSEKTTVKLWVQIVVRVKFEHQGVIGGIES